MKRGEDPPQLKDHQDLRADLGHLDLQDHNLILDHSWDKWSNRLERRDLLQIHSPTCRHKWVLLDLEDHQVSEDLLDHRVSWDLKVMVETQAPLDHLDQRGK